MSIAVITGSAGLIGSEAVAYFANLGFHIVGIDNDMRRQFFGDDATTAPNLDRIRRLVPSYEHYHVDIRDEATIFKIFERYGKAISLVIHTAEQPSHDWAARAPFIDFGINAVGTLNLLEATRQFAPDAVFIFTSTNKVYGDRPNQLPLAEQELRWEIAADHPYHQNEIPESMSTDQCLHSLFGASKVAADVLVQEYGRYFGLRTVCFRGGCLTISGGRYSNCSMLEAIDLVQRMTGCELDWTYREEHRIGDHIWWVSDLTRFQNHYPEWRQEYDIPRIIEEIARIERERWLNDEVVLR